MAGPKGRPPRPGALGDQVQFRCSTGQKARWQAAAELEPRLSFHEWVRRTLDEAADFALRLPPTSTD